MSPRLSSESVELLETTLDTGAKIELVWRLRTTAPIPLADLPSRTRLDGDAFRSALAGLVRDHIILMSSAPMPTLRLSSRARGAAFESLMQAYADDPAVVLGALRDTDRTS